MTSTMKRCSQCGRDLPLTEFRRRRAGSDRPHADCRTCHRLDARDRRAVQAGRRLNRLAADVHRYRRASIGRVVALVGAAIQRFGGLDGFIAAWLRMWNWRRPRGDMILLSGNWR